MEKEELLKEIEKLLSFDGNEVAINPDYLAYFDKEELTVILKTLQKRQDEMVERHKEWFMSFKQKPDI